MDGERLRFTIGTVTWPLHRPMPVKSAASSPGATAVFVPQDFTIPCNFIHVAVPLGHVKT
eukprot:8578528-Ditylum_brightwellii.AAC.1